MNATSNKSHVYRIPASQDYVRNLKNPHLDGLTIIHAFVKVKDFPNGEIPDKINPRSHDNINLTANIPKAISDSTQDEPTTFHLLNRGCLILAKKAWYDNKEKLLHFVIESEDEHGMVDGATTDRVLAEIKAQVAKEVLKIPKASFADFSILKDSQIPEYFMNAYIHIEIIAGDVNGLRINLADARNTSRQVKEFALEELRGNFKWLKDVIEKSVLKGRIKYREDDPEPVDVRTVLALLTLFHPFWNEKKMDPVIAYTGKGRIIEMYQDEAWKEGYENLASVTIDILKLYDFIHVEFQKKYMEFYGPGAKLGKRKEVKYYDEEEKARKLHLTQSKTQYVLADGWLYPLLGSLRVLLKHQKGNKKLAVWKIDPFEFFNKYGSQLVPILVESSEDYGRNPNAVGKSRRVWDALRTKVENQLFQLGESPESSH